MNLQQMIAVGVFLLVMAAIISEKVHRSVAALAGAVVLLLTHVLTIETAADYVDLNTIGVLVGMMLFVAVVKSSGLFEYIAIWSAKLTRGQPMAILAVFAVITAVLSAFLDNVTTVLLIGPMTIAITQILEVNPVPFLLSQIMASNIGGTATLIGDPPNIMIGSAARSELCRLYCQHRSGGTDHSGCGGSHLFPHVSGEPPRGVGEHGKSSHPG